jgi:hypothetical protein
MVLQKYNKVINLSIEKALACMHFPGANTSHGYIYVVLFSFPKGAFLFGKGHTSSVNICTKCNLFFSASSQAGSIGYACFPQLSSSA